MTSRLIVSITAGLGAGFLASYGAKPFSTVKESLKVNSRLFPVIVGGVVYYILGRIK